LSAITRVSCIALASSSPSLPVSRLPRGGWKLKASKSGKLSALPRTSADTRTGRLAAGPPAT